MLHFRPNQTEYLIHPLPQSGFRTVRSVSSTVSLRDFHQVLKTLSCAASPILVASKTRYQSSSPPSSLYNSRFDSAPLSERVKDFFDPGDILQDDFAPGLRVKSLELPLRFPEFLMLLRITSSGADSKNLPICRTSKLALATPNGFCLPATHRPLR